MNTVPPARIRALNQSPVRPDGTFILYWMIAYRRVTWNFALDRAVDWARTLDRPLVVLEALRCDYPWASVRLHRFVLDGMADNARRLRGGSVLYQPYVEPRPGGGAGLLRALGERACVVVTDDFPAFFLPRMMAKAARELSVLLETVDSNGLLPLRAADRAFDSAYSFRRHLQKTLPAHLGEAPKARPLAGTRLKRLASLPSEITSRWPLASQELLEGAGALPDLPIDRSVAPVGLRGGSTAARATLDRFLEERLDRYDQTRNEPERDGTSRLSPFLHFGHLSVHEIFAKLGEREEWSPARLIAKPDGRRTGWWGTGRAAESFLDELITWRELGFNLCAHRDDHDRYESLPRWALATLEKHARDPRPVLYSLGDLDLARTHDPLWNAAQMQLVAEGRIHNYLRMLWGKKILEWSPTPRDALSVMIELNNRYALDGRDPNSYSGIFWVLGRYDRPWGPERPIFGTVRYMSSQNTARKLPVKEFVRRYAPPREKS